MSCNHVFNSQRCFCLGLVKSEEAPLAEHGIIVDSTPVLCARLISNLNSMIF